MMSTAKQERSTYGVEVTTHYVGKRRDGDDWEHHLWQVDLARDGKTISFPFRMGTGHEQTKCGRPKPPVSRYRPTPETACGHARCGNLGWQPTPPDLYSILCSLKADATHGETFADWCGGFGYETDGRKALELYLACQESENRSRAFFGADWQVLLDDEDYE